MIRTLLTSLALLAAPLAAAQDVPEGGFDAHGFVLSAYDGDLRDPLALQRPGRFAAGDWFAGGVLEYANSPLVVVTNDGPDTALDHLLVANSSFGAAAHERVRFDVAVPLFFTTTGLDGGQGVDIGDMRLASMVTALFPDESPIGIGVTPFLDLPTGAQRDFLGNRTVGGGAVSSYTVEAGDFTATANLGLQFNPSTETLNVSGKDLLLYGIAGGWLPTDRVGVNLEARLASPLSREARPWTGTPGEITATVKHRQEFGMHFTGGLAVAATPGVGAATFRAFAGLGYGASFADLGPKDADGDGFVDKVDACPLEAEIVNDYADDDGCPDRFPTVSVDVRKNNWSANGAEMAVIGPEGLLEDWTSDGTPRGLIVRPETHIVATGSSGACLQGAAELDTTEEDVDLLVVLEPSIPVDLTLTVKDVWERPVPTASIEHLVDDEACAPTRLSEVSDDGTGTVAIGPATHTFTVRAPGYKPATEIVTIDPDREGPVEAVVTLQSADPEDATVGERAPVEATVSAPRIRIEQKQIVLLEKVHFATGKAVIESKSFPVLDEVAAALTANQGFGTVEIGGHTDAQGSDSANQQLSERRAKAVAAYLVKQGVQESRLRAIGYGESQPISTNRTSAGRAKNRRVEFLFVGDK